jgi:hypothetical protein
VVVGNGLLEDLGCRCGTASRRRHFITNHHGSGTAARHSSGRRGSAGGRGGVSSLEEFKDPNVYTLMKTDAVNVLYAVQEKLIFEATTVSSHIKYRTRYMGSGKMRGEMAFREVDSPRGPGDGFREECVEGGGDGFREIEEKCDFFPKIFGRLRRPKGRIFRINFLIDGKSAKYMPGKCGKLPKKQN